MKKQDKIKLWAYFMRLGNRCGCHQMEERSFQIKGWQFPICSRCTGILTGQILGIIFHLTGIIFPIYVYFIFLLCMFLDWLIQYKKIRESTNFRRFITGNLAGIAQVEITLKLIIYMIEILF
ncbi:MAG: DUF2085 domain-containing protein [Clostridia bacterium]|nr:DUF2085 domain-containing protein [Clostridia bacterium]